MYSCHFKIASYFSSALFLKTNYSEKILVHVQCQKVFKYYYIFFPVKKGKSYNLYGKG